MKTEKLRLYVAMMHFCICDFVDENLQRNQAFVTDL